MKRCVYVASLDIRVEITHFSRWCGSVLKFHFRRVNCADVSPRALLILNKSSMYLKVLLNWMAFVIPCIIVLTMKSYSKVWRKRSAKKRCTAGVHWYINNLPGNRASKANVDVVNNKVNSLQEKYLYLVDVLSVAQKVRKLLVAMKLFPLVLKTLSKRAWNCFLSRACGRLVKRVEKSQVLTWFRESCFSSSAGITPNELLMIHIQLTPVHSRIVSQLSVQWLRTSLRHSEINLESLVVVYELEPAINLALHGVLWSLRIQFICGKFFSFCCNSMSNTFPMLWRGSVLFHPLYDPDPHM